MATHPLDPLDAAEFRHTAALLRRDGGVTERYRFASVALEEPPKAEVRSWQPGDPIHRKAHAVVWDRGDNHTYEAVVDLTGDRIESLRHVPDATPNFTVDEYHDVDE